MGLVHFFPGLGEGVGSDPEVLSSSTNRGTEKNRPPHVFEGLTVTTWKGLLLSS